MDFHGPATNYTQEHSSLFLLLVMQLWVKGIRFTQRAQLIAYNIFVLQLFPIVYSQLLIIRHVLGIFDVLYDQDLLDL